MAWFAIKFAAAFLVLVVLAAFFGSWGKAIEGNRNGEIDG